MLSATAAAGNEAALARKIESYAAMRAGTRLELKRADGHSLPRPTSAPTHVRARARRPLRASTRRAWPAARLDGTLSIDFAEDAKMGDAGPPCWSPRRCRRRCWSRRACGGGCAASCGRCCAGRADAAISAAAGSTSAGARRPGRRAAAVDRAVQRADGPRRSAPTRSSKASTPTSRTSAHAAGDADRQTEVALSRERSADALRETLQSNLEELQRLSALVNDMLFLSHADRGAVARRGAR